MKQQVRLIPVALTLSAAGLFWYSYKYIPSMSSISRSISILFYVLFLDHISEVKSGETFDTCYLKSRSMLQLNLMSQRFIEVMPNLRYLNSNSFNYLADYA